MTKMLYNNELESKRDHIDTYVIFRVDLQ